MTSQPSFGAAIALNRFGLGAVAGQAPPANPRGWLTAQYAAWDPRPAEIAALPGSAVAAAEFRSYLTELRAAQASGKPADPPVMATETQPAPDALGATIRKAIRQQYQGGYSSQVRARAAAALTSPAPFVERLAWFWANHFAVSADKLQTIGLAGTLEFEAVRPNLLGRYADLLLSVERHPAMLLYLDQAQSIGPNSPLGLRAVRAQAMGRPNARKVGLNENLAREILELHTLGVDGGYAQADVLELARALTGWSVGGFVRRPIGIEAPDGAFVFQPDWHEPGARTLLGKVYAGSGEGQARAMLADLAVHPKTATHLATKLARHFVGDVPPPTLVKRLAAVHVSSGGDLAALYTTLVNAPEAWVEPLPKFKSPWEWTISLLRGVGDRAEPDAKFVGALTELGQPVWRPGSPAGWDDLTATWAAPDALLRRAEVAQRVVQLVGDRIDPRALAPQLLPGLWSPASAAVVARAATAEQGLALLFLSPEFLRR
jgi:uncharacterized protein (DUF1800 family)